MTKSEAATKQRRFIFTIAPFILLVICLAGINLAGWWQHRAAVANGGRETAVITPQSAQTSVPAPATPVETTVPTPTAFPTETPYTPPVFAADTQIQLLGPPESSLLHKIYPVSFYWEWPLELTEDQYFALVLWIDNESFTAGSINEPNLGVRYLEQVDFNTLPINNNLIQWQVQLFSQHNQTPISISEIRTITIQ